MASHICGEPEKRVRRRELLDHAGSRAGSRFGNFLVLRQYVARAAAEPHQQEQVPRPGSAFQVVAPQRRRRPNREINAKSAAVQQRSPIATVNPATGELVQEFTPMSCPV